jgi:hypothetical protein
MQQINEREQWKNWEPEVSTEILDSLLIRSQLYCVVQTSHAQASTRSPDGNAWLRFIAFCPTLDNAHEVARNAHDSGDKMETRILQSGKCALIPFKKRDRGDLDKLLQDQKKANRMYDDYVAQRVKTIEESKERIEASSTSLIPEVVPPPPPPTDTPPQASPCQPIAMDFGKPAEVFMQRYFAMGIIQDTDTELREPVVIPLCAAESMEALQDLVKPMTNNIDLIHIDVFCGTALEWLPLTNPKSSKTIHKHPLRQALEEKIKWVHES